MRCHMCALPIPSTLQQQWQRQQQFHVCIDRLRQMSRRARPTLLFLFLLVIAIFSGVIDVDNLHVQHTDVLVESGKELFPDRQLHETCDAAAQFQVGARRTKIYAFVPIDDRATEDFRPLSAVAGTLLGFEKSWHMFRRKGTHALAMLSGALVRLRRQIAQALYGAETEVRTVTVAPFSNSTRLFASSATALLAVRTFQEPGIAVAVGLAAAVLCILSVGTLLGQCAQQPLPPRSAPQPTGVGMPTPSTCGPSPRRFPEASPSMTATLRRLSNSINSRRSCPQLCPGLVVPRGSECILAVRPVPYIAPLDSDETVTVEVLEFSGTPVLKAQVTRSPLSHTSATEVPRGGSRSPTVALYMWDAANGRLESTMLASCQEGGSEGSLTDGGRHIFIYDSKGQLFGCLGRDPTRRSRYGLRLTSGPDPQDPRKRSMISFDGVFGDYAVSVKNESQDLLADSEACSVAFDQTSKFYRLRIVSGVDAGLIVLCLIAIDEMEAWHRLDKR